MMNFFRSVAVLLDLFRAWRSLNPSAIDRSAFLARFDSSGLPDPARLHPVVSVHTYAPDGDPTRLSVASFSFDNDEFFVTDSRHLTIGTSTVHFCDCRHQFRNVEGTHLGVYVLVMKTDEHTSRQDWNLMAVYDKRTVAELFAEA